MSVEEYKEKNAETKQERLILGFIDEEARHLGYGKLILELTVYDKRITNAQIQLIKRSMNINK